MYKLQRGTMVVAESTGLITRTPQGEWVVDGQVYSDPQHELTVYAPALVGINDFKLLFTITERTQIKALRDTDVAVQDFFSMIDDPRTLDVGLLDPAVREAVAYTFSKLYTDTAKAAQRTAEVLSKTRR